MTHKTRIRALAGRIGALWLAVCAGLFVTGDVAAQSGAAGEGVVQVDITNVVGQDLPAWVELQSKEDPARRLTFSVPKGRAEQRVPLGAYMAYAYVSSQNTLFLVEAAELSVQKDAPAFLLLNLLEGATGNLSLQAFDKDGDCALDNVEISAGTNPEDPSSVPGGQPVAFASPVLAKQARWYCGELHAHSVHGSGRETPEKLIRRAEKAGLDFLAITDRNTLAACADAGFHSDSVVLIPAMEWGTDASGVALLYGPRTVPLPPESPAHAQTVCNRLQAQGGVFAVAHPCSSVAPWQWGVQYVNAIEVWFQDWHNLPPLALEQLGSAWTERKNGKLVSPIAVAAATTGLSGNDQASLFWQYEVKSGLKACAIAGTGTSSPDVPMGQPVTYVYALEKSAAGILDGLRRGRTFLSSGKNGPKIRILGDILDDQRADVSMGGAIPLGVETRLEVTVQGAKGKKLELLADGSPVFTKVIESDSFVHLIPVQPEAPCAFQARVITAPDKPGFGPLQVLAITSPLYAQDIAQQVLLRHPEIDPSKAWIDVRQGGGPEGKVDESTLQQRDTQGEIRPKWEF